MKPLLEIATGDCYEANGRAITDKVYANKEGGWKLCHGLATLATDGKPYGHCWLEYKDEVHDYSNGNHITLPKIVYYALGKIDKRSVLRYNGEEVVEKILKHQHWGPWDYDPPR